MARFDLYATFTLEFLCCKGDKPENPNKPVIVNVRIEDTADVLPDMREWANEKANESAERIAENECNDWSSSLYGCKIDISNLNYWYHKKEIGLPPDLPKRHEITPYERIHRVKADQRYTYYVEFDLTINMCNSVGRFTDYWKGERIRVFHTREYHYSGGVSEFVDKVTNREAQRNLEQIKKDYPELQECEHLETIEIDEINSGIIEVEELQPTEVSKTVYRLLRQRERGSYHIYGISTEEYYQKMHERRNHKTGEIGYTRAEAEELYRAYKRGLVKPKR